MDKQEKKRDHIEFGSEEHAQFLGLRKAQDKDPYQCEGWALVDITQYGPAARPEYLQAILQQKVNELKTKPKVPDYAPKMWVPSEAPVSGIV
jgi:hypothetical protein